MKITLPSTFKSISKVPRHPKKPPEKDPKWTLKLQNVRKLRNGKKNPTAKMSSNKPKLCNKNLTLLLPERSKNNNKSKNHQNGRPKNVKNRKNRKIIAH